MNACPVSVIVRTCNRPRLLERALSSVEAQTCSPREIILVDVSKDCAARQEEVQCTAGIPIVRVRGQVDLSRGAALNLGIQAASADWFAVLDDDDTWTGAFLEKMWAVGRSLDRPVACQSWLVEEKVYDDGKIREIRRRLFNRNFRHIDLTNMAARNEFTINALLCPRSIWRGLGGYRNDLSFLEDWEFNLRLSIRGPIEVVREPLACYHRRRCSSNSPYSNTAQFDHEAGRARLLDEWLRQDLETGKVGLGVLAALGRQQREVQEFPMRNILLRVRQPWKRLREVFGL